MPKTRMVGGSAWVSLREHNKLAREAAKTDRYAAALYENVLTESAAKNAMRVERDDAIRLRNEAQVKVVEVERDLAETKERLAKAEPLANESSVNKRLHESLIGDVKTIRKALRETREALLQKHVLLQTITRVAERRAGINGTIAGTQRDMLRRRIIDGLRGIDTDVARAFVAAWDPKEEDFTFEGAIMAIADKGPVDIQAKANDLLKLSDELREADRKDAQEERAAVGSVVALVNEALAVDMPARNVPDDSQSPWGAAPLWGALGVIPIAAMAAAGFIGSWIYKAKK